MINVLVTGSRGFIGSNLCSVLRRRDDTQLMEYDLGLPEGTFEKALQQAQIIFHLAGVNRPEKDCEFEQVNTGLTKEICEKLKRFGLSPKIVLSSSIQAESKNLYGISKLGAEEVMRQFANDTGAECVIYRLKNLFGKWCRPNYNSVTATFCHNIARGLPIQISDPAGELDLTYVDDVVQAFFDELQKRTPGFRLAPPLPSTRLTLGELAIKINSYREMRSNLQLPDFSSPFEQKLYATYLSYLSNEAFDYGLKIQSDQRGSLAEFLKSPSLGQIFVSRTRPGITRGDHYHHTKTEKFLVLQGEAVIRFRHIENDDVMEYHIRGEDYRVMDIPPGYTHSLENTGQDELVTLFWSSQIFDSERPDTYFEQVLKLKG